LRGQHARFEKVEADRLVSRILGQQAVLGSKHFGWFLG
jgi:hypothetical protein